MPFLDANFAYSLAIIAELQRRLLSVQISLSMWKLAWILKERHVNITCLKLHIDWINTCWDMPFSQMMTTKKSISGSGKSRYLNSRSGQGERGRGERAICTLQFNGIIVMSHLTMSDDESHRISSSVNETSSLFPSSGKDTSSQFPSRVMIHTPSLFPSSGNDTSSLFPSSGTSSHILWSGNDTSSLIPSSGNIGGNF